MKKLPFLIFAIILLSGDLTGQSTFVPFGSDWKYYDRGDEPAKIMGKDFKDADYDDSTWLTGAAQLGYGDGDEATFISNTVLTGYFRHEFTMTNPAAIPSYEVTLIYDDGAVVYLNGNEIGRINMPGGTPGYSIFASGNSGDNAQTIFSVPASSFVTGVNVFAVEVHQQSANSSDISFDLELSNEPPIIRGPYLQKLTTSGVSIKWRTSFPTESIVKYGLSVNTVLNTVSDLTPKTEHELEISNLSGFKYYYQIENSAGILDSAESEMYFQIAPDAGTTAPLNAWILGDPGTANQNARNVRDAYYNYRGTNHTDMILFLGDNAYNRGTDSEYQYAVFEDMYEDLMKKTVSWSCLGNHDGYTANSNSQSGPYYDIFSFPTNGESGGTASGTEAYYSFDYGNVHFIVLESYETDRAINSPMYDWALLDIQSTTQDWIVALWHHPAYTKGSHNSDNNNDSAGSMRDMRENFLPMLEVNGVDLVLSGHSHSYERSYFVNGHYGNSTTFDHDIHTIPINGNGDGQITGTGEYEKDICLPGSVYITTGSAGKITGNGSLDHPVMHYSAKDLGSVVLEVDGSTMNVKFVRESGNIDDFFTIEKGAFGSACDDGDPCTYNDVFDAMCNCAGVVQPSDTDMDGTDDCLDGCPNDPAKIDPGTCGCGVSDTADMDGDLTVDCLDDCPNDPAKIDPGICGCGVSDSADMDSDGTPDCIDNCPTDPNKTEPLICGCGVTESDMDNDGTPDCVDNCPNDPNKTNPGICGCGMSDSMVGMSCDDGDVCTVTDVYNSNCECLGTFADADLDGICDNDDICPGGDDALDADSDGIPDFCDNCDNNMINMPCDDADVCTINDVYNASCICEGTFLDSDGDGTCDANENGCTDLFADDFEMSNNNWTPGIGDALWLMTTESPNGDYSLMIRDNSGIGSSVTSDAIDLTDIDSLAINFNYRAVNMDGSKYFVLEITTDGGATYSVLQTWVYGADFDNFITYAENVGFVNTYGPAMIQFRFRCQGTINDDQVYLDDIVIETCIDSCPDYIVQNTNSMILQSEGVHISIESDGVVQPGNTIDFNAGDHIELVAGFEVQLSGIFHAYIESCQ